MSGEPDTEMACQDEADDMILHVYSYLWFYWIPLQLTSIAVVRTGDTIDVP